MMPTILHYLNLAAASVILLVGLFSVVNNMGHHTQHGMRIAWLMLTTGALATLLGNAAWAQMLLTIGIVAYVLADRRRHGVKTS